MLAPEWKNEPRFPSGFFMIFFISKPRLILTRFRMIGVFF